MLSIYNRASRSTWTQTVRIAFLQQQQQQFSTEIVAENIPILNGYLRQPKFMGSRLSRYMRRELGQLPGILYGVDDFADASEIVKKSGNRGGKGSTIENKKEHQHFRYDPRDLRIPVQLDIRVVEKELTRLGRQFESTCYELVLDDNTRHFVFPRQVHIDPLTDKPTAVNFIKLRKFNKLRIPFQFVNAEHSVDLFAKGSYMIKVNRYLDVVVEGFVTGADGVTRVNPAIPSSIPVDVGGVKTGDIVRLNTKHAAGRGTGSIVTLPPGVHLNNRESKADMLIGVVKAGTK